jgi:hypothetical protein
MDTMPLPAGRLPAVLKIFSRDGEAVIQNGTKLGYRSHTSKL